MTLDNSSLVRPPPVTGTDEVTAAMTSMDAPSINETKLQALFRSVVLQANDVVLVTEAEPVDLASGGPRVVYVNPAFSRMTGYAFEDIVGLTPRLLQSPRTDQTELSKIRAALSNWQPVEVELLNVRKDGTEFWVQISISPAADERGWFTHWIAIQRDITDRKLHEDAIAEMLAGSSDLMLLLDAEGAVTAASRSAAALLGRQPAELVRTSARLLLHPDDRAAGLAVLFPTSALRLGAGAQVDVRMAHADGSWRWMKLTAADLPDKAPGAVVVACADVTEIRRSAAELQQMNDKFRSAFVDAPIGMALSGADGRLLQANAALVQLLGRTESELLQMRMSDLRANRNGAALLDPSTAPSGADGPHPRRQEAVLRRGDGSSVEVLQSSSIVAGRDGRPLHVVDHIEDITDRKSFENQLQHQALHDPLTGLANRALLTDRIEQALSGAQLHGTGVALLFLDLDRFKSINDSLGHPVGDSVLLGVSRLLRSGVRPGDTVARFGGDEFVILCPECTADQAASLAGRIQSALEDSHIGESVEVRLSASIGVVVSSAESTATTLLRDADAAMYAAKARGRQRIEIFDEEVGARVRQRVQLEAELRRGIPGGQLRLHYQPVVELASRRVVGVEALVRWQHPDRGLLPPGDFIALAEESDLILELGTWVLNEAVAAAAALRRKSSAPPIMWVNLSAFQLQDATLPQLIGQALRDHDVPGSALGLEITESVLINDLAHTTTILRALRELGISSAIDDFGTGYSSLSYLARFPVDTVKIDRTFIAGLESQDTRRESYAIINAVIGLARAMKLDLIAEGIETQAQAAALHGLGCDYGQGFLLGRPAPA